MEMTYEQGLDYFAKKFHEKELRSFQIEEMNKKQKEISEQLKRKIKKYKEEFQNKLESLKNKINTCYRTTSLSKNKLMRSTYSRTRSLRNIFSK